jgi:hypothetical protein
MAGSAPNLLISKPNWHQPAAPAIAGTPLSGKPAAATSYAANFKLFAVLSADESGLVSFDRAATIETIPDGAANTIAFAEKYGRCTAAKPIQGAPTNQGISVPADSGGSLWAEPNLNENSPFFAYPQGGNNTYTAGPGLMFQVKPDPPLRSCNPYRAATPHAEGMLVAMCDGSVRSVSPTISDEIWYRAVTPNNDKGLDTNWWNGR